MSLELPTQSPESYEKVPLLREAVEVLINELAAISEHRADELPALKKRKVVLASRLGALDWSPSVFEHEAFDLSTLRSLITDLEAQSREKIEGHLTFIGNQLLALQEEHQYWRECMNVSFRKFCESSPAL